MEASNEKRSKDANDKYQATVFKSPDLILRWSFANRAGSGEKVLLGDEVEDGKPRKR